MSGDRGVVDEDVRASRVLGDEAEALVVVEPLDGSLSHVLVPWSSRCAGTVPATRAEDIRTAPDAQKD
jgi:hypothetical protein